MKNKTLTIVQHILVIAVALFTLNGLSFSLTSGDTGFLLLSFSSLYIGGDYEWGLFLIGLLCWLQFLFSLAAIALGISSIFMRESAKKLIGTLVLIGSVVFCFLYMLEGSIETAICNLEDSYGGFATTAFIPFLLNVVMMIVYFIIPNFAKKMQYNAEHYPNYDNNSYRADNENIYHSTTPVTPPEGNADSVNQSVPSAKKDIDPIVFYVKSYIPDERVMSFRNMLLQSEANDLSFISMVPLKNPTTVLLFSIFLGGLGVDRFYIGDTGLGVAKLLLSSFTFGIWPLIDIFLCYKKAKVLNYNKLLSRLKYHN